MHAWRHAAYGGARHPPLLASTVIPLRQSAVEASLKKAAFDHLSLPVLCFNAAAQVLAANTEAGRLLGLPCDVLVGRHLSTLVGYPRHRDSARRWARLWTALLDKGRVSAPVKVPLASGTRVALQLDAELLRFEQDTVAVVALRDIGERLRSERERRAREGRAWLLAHSPAEVTLLLGRDRRVLEVGGRAEALGGMTAEQLRGVPFELLLDDGSSGAFLAAFGGLSAKHGTAVGRYRLRGRSPVDAGQWLEIALTDRTADPLVGATLLQVRNATAGQRPRTDASLSERRLRAFIEGAADLLMVLDAEGRVRFQAPGIRRILGVAPEATMAQAAWRLLLADDQPALKRVIDAAVRDAAGEHVHTCLVRATAAGGSVHRLWVSVRNYLADNAVGGLLLSARDITAALAGDPNSAEQARRLEYRERLLEMAVQTRADFAQTLSGALRTTAETLRASTVSFWRRARSPELLRCESLFDGGTGRFVRDWIGVELPAGDHPEYFARLRERQPLVIADTRHHGLTARLSHDPRRRHVRALMEAPVLLDGEVQGLLCVHHNATRAWDDDEVNFVATTALLLSLALEAAQRQEAESRIEQLAWYDSLTGLANRNLLRESMRDMIMTAANRRRRIAAMLIDLDRFKDVNDTLGHLVGDALIKSAAQVLRETVGDQGMVARLGGDEFVILVNDFEHRQEVALLAARIAQALHRTDLVPNVDTQVSASIGVALFPEHGRDMSTLLKNADAAMYQAKRDGRNQFSFFNPIRYERAAREVQLGIQLLKAVQSDKAQFVVEYQPQVEIGSGRVVGFEALIRWQHPTFGLLTPDRFIGVAEVSGLSERITRWVLNEVCAQIVRWREQRPGFDIPVAVNVAGRELGSAALPMLVRSTLLRHGVEPQMIALEITERTLVKEGDINNDVMTELASLGVGLVLDDFGTGYSMLGYLKRMPIQALKIDYSFIEGIPGDADSCAIVHAMLAVARHFKLKVVAEGVETAEQAAYLRSIGCEYAQGYHYSRVLSAQTILDFLTGGQTAPVQ